MGAGNNIEIPTGHLTYGLLTNKVTVITFEIMKNYGEELTFKC